jgi:hypothetical protein
MSKSRIEDSGKGGGLEEAHMMEFNPVSGQLFKGGAVANQ